MTYFLKLQSYIENDNGKTKERSFVSSILAEEACYYFSFIKNIINIPLKQVMGRVPKRRSMSQLLGIVGIVVTSVKAYLKDTARFCI